MGRDSGKRYAKVVFSHLHSILRTLFVPIGYGDDMFLLSKRFKC